MRINLGVSRVILSKTKDTDNHSGVLVVLDKLPIEGIGMSSKVRLSSNAKFDDVVIGHRDVYFTALDHLEDVSSTRWSPAPPDLVHGVCKKSVNGRKGRVSECISRDVIDINHIKIHSHASTYAIDELDGGVGNVCHFVVAQMHLHHMYMLITCQCNENVASLSVRSKLNA
jgi:hypothetical protein